MWVSTTSLRDNRRVSTCPWRCPPRRSQVDVAAFWGCPIRAARAWRATASLTDPNRAYRPQTPGTDDDEVIGARVRLVQDGETRGAVCHLVALDVEPRGRQSVGCRPGNTLRMGGSLNPDLLVGLEGERGEHNWH